ncbi:Uncharacterised protein [Yersinia frederiksenii]|nr:Uncharacterised protein [Yersinia frederiksenii]
MRKKVRFKEENIISQIQINHEMLKLSSATSPLAAVLLVVL